jgi:integrase
MGLNPTRGIRRYTEKTRERFLNLEELDRLGAAIREAETVGIPWDVDGSRPTSKHIPKTGRQTPISAQAAAALRLLLFTGARLREVLHLRWDYVDFERAALFLPDSKTGKKTVYLNGPALAVLQGLPRSSVYVFPGEPRGAEGAKAKAEQPRHDLKRPWQGVQVGGGLGLPIIAKLLGHAQIRTTERYSHLDADPIRRASESIGKHLAEAMGEGGFGVPSDLRH